MNINTDNLIQEFTEASRKMIKGYEILSKIENIDVATAPKELVWQDGKVKCYRYTRETPATVKTPVLINYALVNRQDMMDIQPDRSYIRNLLGLGVDLYMMDWGYATRADKFVSMNDYINGYINDAVDFIREDHGIEKVSLMGVCQGGTFSVIYAALHPEKVKNLITLVTPIDFNTEDGLLFKWSKNLDIDAIVDYYGSVPGEFLNEAFSMLKPMMKANKYVTVLNSMEDENKMMNYLRMEKWIADSPNQAGECFRQFLKDLYQGNKLINGTFELNGEKVDLKKITMPLLNIYAEEDHLVPPSATIPLNNAVGTKDATLYKFKGGHIGVFVGSRSQKELAPAVAEWLAKRDN
jgi:polyhydroxyalkanoate synthase